MKQYGLIERELYTGHILRFGRGAGGRFVQHNDDPIVAIPEGGSIIEAVKTALHAVPPFDEVRPWDFSFEAGILAGMLFQMTNG